MSNSIHYTLGIDIGSTTVKIAILDEAHHILFSDYKRHFANIQETLEALHVQPSNVTLELTETYLIKEDAGTRDILEKMKKMGINLAMDDFGIGYSSLFSLKNIPVDIVKIDRGFVKGITSDLFNATFVRAITELCHDVGKKVCLEGVETKEEYDVVKNSGLELIQGFYFGYPINAEMFEKQWL